MVGAAGVDGDVAHDDAAVDRDEVDGADHAAGRRRSRRLTRPEHAGACSISTRIVSEYWALGVTDMRRPFEDGGQGNPHVAGVVARSILVCTASA